MWPRVPEITKCCNIRNTWKKQSLRCLHCEYQSGMYKLYDEVDTGSCGQKPATSNVTLHVGLQDSTVGITKIRNILAATNTPPPSRHGLQRNADRVAAITAQATMDNLKQKREQTKEINIMRGLPENAPINISMDVRYNSTTVKNSYGVGQAASQAIGAAIEWQTDEHQIVGFHLENKLCKVGSMLRSQDHNVTCPGHERCSATLRAVDPISEYDIGKQIGHSFAQDNVRYVATDGDASASRVVQDAMPAVSTERQADTTHLGQTQFRHIMKASFSPRMFPGETAIIRAENKIMFAEDVKTRCQKIYTNVHTLYSSDITTITSKMPRIIQTTIDCYAGSCKNCRRHAVVCRGGLQNNWWHKSQHLKASGVTRLNMTDADRLTLQGLIEMRLGNAALQMTRHRLTTDKNESINRSFSASLPKNVNFSRNAQGRVCSVIDRINYGAGISMLRKLENVNCPITKGGRVALAVKDIQHGVVYQRAYSRRPSVRLHRRRTKLNRMRDYFEAKRNRRQVDIYRKGQLDPKPATQAAVARASTSTSVVTITATATRPVVKRRRRQRKSLADHTDHPYLLRSRKSADHNYASRV